MMKYLKWIFPILGIGLIFFILVLGSQKNNTVQVGNGIVPCLQDSTKSVATKLGDCSASITSRADFKAEEIAKLNFIGTKVNTKYGITIEIQSIQKIDKGIEIMARAWKDGKQL